MTITNLNRIADILTRHQQILLELWVREQLAALDVRQDLLSEVELRRQSAEFLAGFCHCCRGGGFSSIQAPEWLPALAFLEELTGSWARKGLTSSETAIFVLSLKQPLFASLFEEFADNSAALAEEIWNSTVLLDQLALYTTEVFVKSREAVFKRQQLEVQEVSTPVIKLWEGILAVPLVGALDSARMLAVMENLLQNIVDTGSGIAIVDVAGVLTLDSLAAQHLLKTAAAARLMGAQFVLSGIRPQIAQAMVQLGVEFGDVVTKATFADAMAYAFRQIGRTVIAQELH